ncbi:MAG: SURF1 family protein [Gammaproteobacteria bacterium]
MTVATRKFRPPAWATLSVIVACALFALAGVWQLDRADEKRRMFTTYDASGVADVLTAPVPDAELEASLFRPLRLTGRYDTSRQFLLDVMVHEREVGYHVLTPLRRDGHGDDDSEGDGLTVLVNRGWIPAGADRSALPDIGVDTGEREVSGLIAPLPRAGIRIDPGSVDAAAPWPRRLTFPSAADIRGHMDGDIAGYQLLLDPEHDDGFIRAWRPTVMSPNNHLSYAVQWFGLAIALVVIYVAVNLKSNEDKT